MPIDEHAIPYGTVFIADSNVLQGPPQCQPVWQKLESIDQISLDAPDNRGLLDSISVALNSGLVEMEVALMLSAAIVRLYFIPSDRPAVRAIRHTFDDSHLSRLAAHFSNIMHCTSTSLSRWNGDFSDIGELIYPTESSDTLSDLYDSLPSPKIDYSRCSQETVNLIDKVLSSSGIKFLKSSLFQYQKETVAKMIQQELHPGSDIDPLYLPLLSIIDHNTFYFQPTTIEVLRYPPLMAQCHGGILSEELGSGKTCMLLGLILCTRDQLPCPEESLSEPCPVLTPLSTRAFRTQEVLDSIGRHRTPSPRPQPDGCPLPSLMELLIHQIRILPEQTAHRNLPRRLQGRNPAISNAIRHNTPFYLHSDLVAYEEPRRKRRNNEGFGPRKVLLSNATLLLLPSHLLIQWQTEIHKHCKDGALRVIVIDSANSIPHPNDLANDYDLVIMTHQRFAAEAKKANLDDLYSWGRCVCSSLGEFRVPDCQCKYPTSVSPLLGIRWKRLIVDEGHIVSEHTANLASLAKILSAERRWMVSGTPTTNLLGLGLGRNAAMKKENSYAAWQDLIPGFSESPEADKEEACEFDSRWPQRDRSDLLKLASIMVHFLQMPQFSSQPRLFSRNVCGPLLRHEGPAFGSTQVLKQVMAQIMIRHTVEDIEREVTLPPLEKTSVLLDMDPISVVSYNLIQSQLLVNAIDSERTDQDYFFHPHNAGPLKRITEGLSQAMFWQADPNHFRVNETLVNARGSLQRVLNGLIRATPSDELLLREAIKHLEAATLNTKWRAIQAREEIPYRVRGLPEEIRAFWSRFDFDRLHEERALADSCGGAFMHADRIVKLRQEVFRRRTGNFRESLVDVGRRINEEDSVTEKRIVEMKVKRRPSRSGGKRDGQGKGRVHRTISRAQQDAMISDERECASATFHSPGESHQEEREFSAQVTACLSSKLHWILQDVLAHSKDCKYLIFSSSPLTLAHVGDGLEVLNIPYLSFSSTTNRKSREQMPTTFETSDHCRIFLMELKHGARGLNLISASRVIFCEPVWAADVESQAIKRAHRIGQTKAITVVTLAIRSTIEEEVVKYRMLQQGRHHDYGDRRKKQLAMIGEPRMRAFLENPQFLESKGGPIWEEPLLSIEYALPEFCPEENEEMVSAQGRGKRVKLEEDTEVTL